ncbi:9444_t:CDS:2, partial [Entrophospora sp. SA101]
MDTNNSNDNKLMNLSNNVDLNKFNRLNNSCVSSLKDFSILLESSSNDLNRSKEIANKWKGSIQIPDKEFSQLNLNETKSIDYGEKMKKSSQEAV